MTDIRVRVIVKDATSKQPIENARITISGSSTGGTVTAFTSPTNPFLTAANGIVEINIPSVSPGTYDLKVDAYSKSKTVQFDPDNPPTLQEIPVDLPFGADMELWDESFGAKKSYADADQVVGLQAQPTSDKNVSAVLWEVAEGELFDEVNNTAQPRYKILWDPRGASGATMVTARIRGTQNEQIVIQERFNIRSKDSKINVSLNRTELDSTADQALWVVIRNRANAIAFSEYTSFVDKVLCKKDPIAYEDSNRSVVDNLLRYRDQIWTPLSGVAAYDLLKTATQAFLLIESGLLISEVQRYSRRPLYIQEDEERRLNVSMPLSSVEQGLRDYLGEQRLPYIRQVLDNAFVDANEVTCVFDEGFLKRRTEPIFLELIWSYWHEESMMVQAMNAISVRFQNQRSSDVDPLAHLEVAPLWPINNLIWGYIQDEQSRLTVRRRAYEYDHQYGLNLLGKAVPDFRPADSRSQFIEAFHNLLGICTTFYRQADDTTVIPDGFPLLNALKEVHLLLAQGAHNQFGDLPWTARAEMLMQQWVLARPEMREFLQSRAMVPYREPWMGQVDTMKRLQNWGDISVTSFNDLARFGEMLLLSVRYGNWIAIDDSNFAANWAHYWRAEIQGYIHAYRSVTGVDLTVSHSGEQYQEQLRTALPSTLLQQRLQQQQQRQQRRQTPVPAPGFAPSSNGKSNGHRPSASASPGSTNGASNGAVGSSNGNGASPKPAAQPENLRQRRAVRR